MSQERSDFMTVYGHCDRRMRCPDDRDYIFRNPSVFFGRGDPSPTIYTLPFVHKSRLLSRDVEGAVPYKTVPQSFVRKNRL